MTVAASSLIINSKRILWSQDGDTPPGSAYFWEKKPTGRQMVGHIDDLCFVSRCNAFLP